MPILGNSHAFVLFSNDVAVDVLEKHKRDSPFIAKLDKLGGLQRTVREKNAVVPQYSHGIAVDISPAADYGGPVEGLEFKEFTAVNHTCDDFPNVIRRDKFFGDNAVDFFWVIERGFGFPCPDIRLFGRRKIPDDLVDDLNTVGIILCKIIGDP